jgi:peptidyl-prolyl cis-trans isomerase C
MAARSAFVVGQSVREIVSMPRIRRLLLFVFILIGLAPIATLRAQTQPQQAAPAAPATGAAPTRAPAIPGAADVLATVTVENQTDKITKGDVVTFLSHYPMPDEEDRDSAYRQTVDSLVNTRLLTMFLSRQRTKVAPEKVDEQLEALKQELKKDGQDLPSALLQSGISIDDVRKEYENRIRWSEYVREHASDATLRKFVADHHDLFSGTQLRASHILIKLDPTAGTTEKEKARQKLAAIKKEIEGGTLTFAIAANKFSEDPANSGGAGGDLDYFSLTTGLVEEFTDVAFRLKKGVISDPVETPFGMHLIQVTDRKEGRAVDFEQNKPYILNMYGNELQKTVVTAERKRAKVDIKPLPKDLFPSQPAVAPAGTPETTKAAPPAAATPPK